MPRINLLTMKATCFLSFIVTATAQVVMSYDDHGNYNFHHHHHHHRGLSQAPRGCGFQAPDSATIEEMAIAQEERVALAQQEQERRSGSSRLFRCGGEGGNDNEDTDPPPKEPIKIVTYVHAIEMADGTGFLSDAAIEENVRMTNELLLSSGFQLIDVSINRITDDTWYLAEWNSIAQNEMHAELKVGDLSTLNIYYKAAILEGITYCGYANLAENAIQSGNSDGIVIDTSCATDKTTLAHEVGKFIHVAILISRRISSSFICFLTCHHDSFPGHWLNLLHTFDGGCSPGDLVDDTNPQGSYVGRYNTECPSPLPDTCPDLPGADPLDNIMDYAPLGCDDIFSEGQAQRMKEAWDNIRNKPM